MVLKMSVVVDIMSTLMSLIVRGLDYERGVGLGVGWGWGGLALTTITRITNDQLEKRENGCNTIYSDIKSTFLNTIEYFCFFENLFVRSTEVNFCSGSRKTVRFNQVSALQCPLYRGKFMCIC